ncbi:hypothetical protein [Pseudoduganella sp. GCM10020061]|uniref:hypothetical protein n=1 Tax=Pseudoduganella sp. GCM10020061 TaxID=3317345 RepID=UPI00363A76C8
MSGNRKRPGTGGILDQLEPKTARKAAAGFSIGIEPRWVWAGGGAIVLMVAALAAVAWSTTTKARPLQPSSGEAAPVLAHKPVFESGPARVERVALAPPKPAPIMLAQVEPPPMPPPMPLVVLPREKTATPPAKAPARSATAQKRTAPAAAAGKPPGQRTAARRNAPVPKAQRAKPEPAPEAVPDNDPDVALIRAIRKATKTQSP